MGKAKAARKSGGEGRQVRISKTMTLVLRHTALDLGLQVRPDGFVPLQQLLACQAMRKLAATAEDVEQITRSSDKQRFEVKQGQGEILVRAVQGHSMKAVLDEDSLRRLRADDANLPRECVHGTYRRHLNAILCQGLKAGGKEGQSHRNHVHFAPRAPDGEVISGMRADCDVAIWLDLAAAIRSGIAFYMAKNEVILSPGVDGVVPAEYFEKILDLKTGADLLHATAVAKPPLQDNVGTTPLAAQAEELTAGLARYRKKAARTDTKADACSGLSESQGNFVEVLKILSPATRASPAQELLAQLAWRGAAPGAEGSSSGQFECAVIYLHGFPDQCLDHRQEHEAYGSFSSRFTRKLAEAVLGDIPGALFVAFNFAGTPGSDGSCEFATKTVSREVLDAKAVLRFLRSSGRLPAPAPCHVVGLSTGAIVASLLRGYDPHMTVTAVAGLVDVEEGLHYDFDEDQLRDFDCEGHCLKDFWLPTGSPSNPHDAVLAPCKAQATSTGSWQKHHLRLDAEYREDFLSLDVAQAVRSAKSPLLVIHGENDTSVPIASGEALFAAAAEPKQLLIIKGGNHLLSNTKHFQKAARAITDMMKNSPGTCTLKTKSRKK